MLLLRTCAVVASWAQPPYLSVNTAGNQVFRYLEGGYNCTRIPTVILAGSSTLLAFAEGRNWVGDECVPFPGPGAPATYHVGIDAKGHTDTVMKRSTNGGRDWSALAVVASGSWCPTAVWDAQRRRVVLQYSLYTDDSVWQAISTDLGRTFGPPLNVSAQLPAGRAHMLGGTGHSALQLSLNHRHFPARLLWIGHLYAPGSDPRDASEYCWWSDDGGATFGAGASMGVRLNEASLTELPGTGEVYANLRSDAANTRMVARSTDGGASFTAPTEDLALTNGQCEASVLRVHNLVLFANPATYLTGGGHRCNGTLRVSIDGARTWLGRTIPLGIAPLQAFAYSSLTHTMNESEVGVLFETGAETVKHANGSKSGCYGTGCQIRYRTVSIGGFV